MKNNKEYYYNSNSKKFKYSFRKLRLVSFVLLIILFIGIIHFPQESMESIILKLYFLANILNLSLFFYLRKKNRNKEYMFLQKHIEFLLESNHLIIKEKNKNGKEIIIYEPVVKYWKTDDFLIIAFLLDGSAVSESFENLDRKLMHLFQMPLVKKSEENGFICYYLARKADRRIDTTRDNLEISTTIPLTEKIKWNINKSPHALIIGSTGSGKTYFLLYLISCFHQMGADIKIIDPKRSDLAEMGNQIGYDTAYEPNPILKILRETVEEMNARYDHMRAAKKKFGDNYSSIGLNPLVIFFDELMSFMSEIEVKNQKEAMSYLTSIIAKGRQAGVFIMISIQRPDSVYLNASIRDQLGLRVALGTNISADGYAMCFGNQWRDLAPTGHTKGIGFVHIDGVTAQPIQFEAPYIPSTEEFIEKLKR